MVYSFLAFLLIFISIGVLAHRKSAGTTADYLLAGKDVKPWLAGFSFFSTENSGVMFVGFVGLIYMIGLPAIWLFLGWYGGEILILTLTAHRFRDQTDKVNAQTYSQLLSNWHGKDYEIVRRISAVIIILFLCVYAAAQLSAGGKALNVVLDWDLRIGAFVGFIIVIIYCLSGGLRATIWTDAAQTIVMLLSLILIVWVSLAEIGGLGALYDRLEAIDPTLVDVFAGSYKYGIIGFFAGWLFAGIGVVGQSHVMVRFMVVKDGKSARKAVGYYAALVVFLSFLCMIASLCARVLLPELASTDPELSLPSLSEAYLPDVLAGVFLAGLFAATMSTADSQILSSSAALTQDVFSKFPKNILWAKLGTLGIGLSALCIVLSGWNNVFKLATFAWAFMASSMAPLFFLYMIGKKPTQAHAVSIMVIGAAVSMYWEYAGLSEHIYNVLPGILTGLASYWVLWPIFKSKV